MTIPQANPDPLVAAVGRYIDERFLIAPREAVLVGVSGGCDSVALLAVLRELAADPERAYRLTVAHMNHLLRDDAALDERLVADLAGRWGLPFVSHRVDVREFARSEGLGIEQAARQARYDFLLRSARQCGAATVAVAHHADDNVETVLYRIVRGTHIRGLCGMPDKRALVESACPEESFDETPAAAELWGGTNVMLVRPFLDVRREQIEAFAARRQLNWRHDSTNADTAYRRNFIRHSLLPMLREGLNARCDEAILRLARSAGEVESFLSEQAQVALDQAQFCSAGILPASSRLGRASSCESHLSLGDTIKGGTRKRRSSQPTDLPARTCAAITINAPALAGRHPAVRSAAIRLALERAGVPMRQVGADRLAELAALVTVGVPPAVALPGGWLVRRSGDVVTIHQPSVCGATHTGAQTPADPAVSVCVNCPGVTPLPDGGAVECRFIPFDQGVFDEHRRLRPPGVEMLDADQVRPPLSCRPRRDGDGFVPLGAPGRQSVSDFLTNLKLAPVARSRVLCLCDELGIVYLAPLRIDHRVRVTPSTRRLLVVQFAMR